MGGDELVKEGGEFLLAFIVPHVGLVDEEGLGLWEGFQPLLEELNIFTGGVEHVNVHKFIYGYLS
jgi:hypothetical protein